MNLSSLKSIISAVAPTLGTALGGPLGGAAAQAIASALGCDPDTRSLEKAIAQATPEQLTEIKKAELSFQARMKELDVDIFALETADIQNARAVHGSDWTPRIIALACIIFFGGYIFMVTIQPPEQNSEAVINLVLGYLGGIVSAITSFYFGASHKQNENK
jgi:hypothetical protein